MPKKIKASASNFKARIGVDKAHIVEGAERIYRRHVGDERPAGSCLYWAMSVISAAKEAGLRLIPQAGTACFQRLPIHLDDGDPSTLTHFSYEWQPGSKGLVSLGGKLVLPEMHVWAADPVAGEIVDLSTRRLAEMCEATTGMPWLESEPPRFLWSRLLPAGWIYVPNREATELAVTLMIDQLSIQV